MTAAPDLDAFARDLARATPDAARDAYERITGTARRAGIHVASLRGVYHAFARDEIPAFTVPAFNVRGLTYPVARALWRSARRADAGPVILELAPIEAEVSRQSFAEYAAMILAAAIRENYTGPVFLQGDHFSVYEASSDALECTRQDALEAIHAGFRQIDFDASALGGHDGDAAGRQAGNARATAALVTHARSAAPDACLGGEVGEIGSANTSPEDLRAFLDAVQAALPPGTPALDKVSVQTGTAHGGRVNRDGTVGRMPLDTTLARELSGIARREYGLAGVVQHGASTLALDQLAELPAAGVIEVHLATGIQNRVFDHPDFPHDFREQLKVDLEAGDRDAEGGKSWLAPDASAEQRFYSNRWRAWGTHKQQLWDLPDAAVNGITASLESWFDELLAALRVAGRRDVLDRLYPRGAQR